MNYHRTLGMLSREVEMKPDGWDVYTENSTCRAAMIEAPSRI